jgi:uncharacterized integral membrane protein
MQLGFIVILIIAIFVAIFAIQNGTPVPIDMFFARYEMPLALIMMACLILGAVVVLLLGSVRQIKKSTEAKGLKNQVKVFENDKVQYENNIKAMETEIQTLKQTNTTLAAQVEELKNKNKEQENTILKMNEDLKTNAVKTE